VLAASFRQGADPELPTIRSDPEKSVVRPILQLDITHYIVEFSYFVWNAWREGDSLLC
jgi:hypothetical protein